MTRLKLYFLLFCIGISIPLSYVIWQTYAGVAQEERAQLQFFADALFDDMQKELNDLIEREESRPVDEYHITRASSGKEQPPSPLASLPDEDYIVGYLQNNPDGRMQTPLVADLDLVPADYQKVVTQLQEVNRAFNQKKRALPTVSEPPTPAPVGPEASEPRQSTFADRYLSPTKRKSSTAPLGQKSVRVEELTSRQISNIASQSAEAIEARQGKKTASESDTEATMEIGSRLQAAPSQRPTAAPAADGAAIQAFPSEANQQRFQAEVAPMQSVFIDEKRVFIFRRVAVNDQILRQGFVLMIEPFLRHMADVHFNPHPMAAFSRLSLMSVGRGRQNEIVGSGMATQTGRIVSRRTFPAPFHFISAALLSDHAPASPARKTLNVALAALGAVLLLGLFAIYHSVRSVVDLSERRSQFVSSVTHELKTPLTNIRMYVEMLEQGIAATPEREQDYLGVIGSESTRLSRLIDNVLELSKLEKKQRIVHLEHGRIGDLLNEVASIMSPKLRQEGFSLTVQADRDIELAFEREAMLQVLINLIENSIKFGRSAPERRIRIGVQSEEDWVRITVCDTGPGIPGHALKRIFDDFYRADNALTRATSGTGIGLALVKKLVTAMDGRVEAANNPDTGCTITVKIPFNTKPSRSDLR